MATGPNQVWSRATGRPHQSNDNPFSESNFKTYKYVPSFPKRFANLEAARAFSDMFFDHTTTSTATRASACTPRPTSASASPGGAGPAQVVLDAAYAFHPERFRNRPSAPRIPEAAWINRPEETPLAIELV